MDPLAASVLSFVIKKLATTGIEEIAKLWKVDEELKGLLATCKKIQPLLDGCCNDVALQPLLDELERYCYKAEDLVDLLDLTRGTDCTVRNQIFKSSFYIKPLITPRKIVALRNKLEKRIGWIEDVLRAGQIGSSQHQLVPRVSAAAAAPSLLSDMARFVPGTSRDCVKQYIVKGLTDTFRGHSYGCGGGVSIIGIDGLGKTALARTIMVDETIGSYFRLVICASVSNHFQMEDVVHKLVEYHRGTTTNSTVSMLRIPDSLMLKNLLSTHRRVLIILDDVWSVGGDEWDRFKTDYLDLCDDGFRIWKIITTTRNPEVADVTRSIKHYLDRMTDDDCKKLILEKANLSGSACEIWNSDIEAIAKKCKGMPIVANKFGLKLYSKLKEDDQKDTIIELKTKKLWELKEFEEVFPFLKLNVPKLPLDLKRCFAYCSLFPPTHQFNRVDLSQLWEVEGFIQPQQNQGVTHPFDVMLSRSILLPCESRDNKQQAYKMDEFNHEFAHSLAPKTFYRLCQGTSNLLPSRKSIHHLSLTCYNIDESLWEDIGKFKRLRTFLLLHSNEPRKRTIPRKLFDKLRVLRLLDLSHTTIRDVSKSTLSKHLRYLDLSHTEVKELPSLRLLHALQILKLKGCSKLKQLPNDFNELVSLTHLHVEMKILRIKPSNLGTLTKLEVLDSFVVGTDKGPKILELRDMEHLQEIRICGLENISLGEEAREAKLIEKPWLRKLVLEWDNTERTAGVENADAILEALQPHSHLRSLEVRNYGGRKFPTWLGTPSCQLVSIFLDGCESCDALPSLGELPILKNLVLRYINKVKFLDDQFYGQGERSAFPCLESLEFHYMEGLVNWAELKGGDMHRLRALRLSGCPKLVHLPSFQHLSCLLTFEINNCPKLLSLPELPSSMNSAFGELIVNDEFGELIIIDCALVKERCQIGGADWLKIKNISYVEIDNDRVSTIWPFTSNQPSGNDEDEVLVSEDWFTTFTYLLRDFNLTQLMLGNTDICQGLTNMEATSRR